MQYWPQSYTCVLHRLLRSDLDYFNVEKWHPVILTVRRKHHMSGAVCYLDKTDETHCSGANNYSLLVRGIKNKSPMKFISECIISIYVRVILYLVDIHSKTRLGCRQEIILTADAGNITMYSGQQDSVSWACVKKNQCSFETWNASTVSIVQYAHLESHCENLMPHFVIHIKI